MMRTPHLGLARLGILGARRAAYCIALGAAFGCGASTSPQANTAEFAGTWAILSSRIVYDNGGGSSVGTSGPTLTLGSNGTWSYGSSHGSFSVASIVTSDWTRWEANPYGPVRKLSFPDWSPAASDGPVDEGNGQINYIWVLYRAGPPLIGAPGLVELRFYRTR